MTTTNETLAWASGYAPGGGSTAWACVQIARRDGVLVGRQKYMTPDGEGGDDFSAWGPLKRLFHYGRRCRKSGTTWFPRERWYGNVATIDAFFAALAEAA